MSKRARVIVEGDGDGDLTESVRASVGSMSTNERSSPETTLGSLAEKFVALMMQAPDGIIDLNKAAEELQAKKRRIYDVTNVLQGVDLIVKGRKNTVEWKGCDTTEADQATDAKAAFLRRQIGELEEAEKKLNSQIAVAEGELMRKARDHDFKSKLFLRTSDLGRIEELRGSNVFLLKGPRSTEIYTPKKAPENETTRSRMMISSLGRIELGLFNAKCMDRWEANERALADDVKMIEQGNDKQDDKQKEEMARSSSILQRDLRQ